MKAMLFERLIDHRDRKKIARRTRFYHKEFDYQIQLPDPTNAESISFLVVGDTGAGDESSPMKYYVADQMHLLDQEEEQDLIIHVGDVVYLSGSKQGYPLRFIKTYRHWLVNGTRHRYDNMVFTKPFLPIYGNHDYYDFGRILPGVGRLLGLLHESIGSGSKIGRVFEKAFIISKNHSINENALNYIPGKQTRLPNRYYWYTQGPCAFFGLDSNTLDIVKAPSQNEVRKIKEDLEEIENEIEKGRKGLEHYKDLEAKGQMTEPLRLSFESFFYQLAEREKKAALLKKRLDANKKDHDTGQLIWLDKVLGKEEVKNKWKIVYLHHSLYSSEGGHVDDIATGGLRENLRKLFVKHGVHLVLSGHSHCFEWVQRKKSSVHSSDSNKELAEAERKICYLVTGGGGQGLRDSVLDGFIADQEINKKQNMFLKVAESKAYTATFADGEIPEQLRNVHNFLSIRASQESLKIFPKGVALKNGEPYLLPNFYTKVFDVIGGLISYKLKTLRSITLSKNKMPLAEWDEIPE